MFEKGEASGRSAVHTCITGRRMAARSQQATVQLPAPTAWPMVLALGISLMIAGMVTHWVISLLGRLLMLRCRDRGMVLRGASARASRLCSRTRPSCIQFTAHATHLRRLPSDERHRKLIPIETFSVDGRHQRRHRWRHCNDCACGALQPSPISQHLVCSESVWPRAVSSVGREKAMTFWHSSICKACWRPRRFTGSLPY